MRRLTWPEMVQYWESHVDQRAPLDERGDPDALNNVCYTGAPLWLNKYHASLQAETYLALLAAVGPLRGDARALDIGCGAGRWCRVLQQRGYEVVGIDLQRRLIERNRSQFPEVEFVCTSVQEYEPSDGFDLVSSVTVVQHNPYAEQVTILEKLRRLTRLGGHALLLENVRDEAPDVFSRSVDDWRYLFEQTGFRVVKIRRYDYSLMLRLLRRTAGVVRHHVGADAYRVNIQPDQFRKSPTSGLRLRLRAVNGALTRIAVGVDRRFEPELIFRQPELPTVHCGFLLRAA